jgi:hypothetical protein
MMRLLFEDKRYTMILLVTWMTVTCGVFYQLGAFRMHFMTFGPSEQTIFMGMTINTWHKWYCLAIFSFLNTSTNEFLGNALMPWFQNTIQDHKCQYIPYTKTTCITIIMLYDVYTHVMSIFGIYLLFSQIDFLIIRLVADILITLLTTYWFLQHKITDEDKYLAEVQHVNPSDTRDPQEFEESALLPTPCDFNGK